MGQASFASGFDQALGDFAHDISGADPEIAAHVARIIAHPPTTLEEIGFYGAEDKSAQERKTRAVIFRLSEGGHILGFEDKYIHEMAYVLQDQGILDADFEAGALMTAAEGYYNESEDDPEPKVAAALQSGFVEHVTGMEQAAKAAGRELLYIDVPLGDTFHLVALSPDVAAKWRNVVLLEADGARFAITAPQWDIYYDFLSYAFQLSSNLPGPVAGFDPSGLRSLKDLGYAP